MELKHVANPIGEAGAAKQVLSNLFYGWGYNFYRRENQLRADDLLIRGKLSELLGEGRAHIASLEAAYRREHLPPPTREQPFPDSVAVAQAQALQRVQRDIESLETTIRTASVPEMDRVHQRHQNEADVLEKLVAVDSDMVEASMMLRDAILRIHDAATAPAAVAEVLDTSAIRALWNRRQEVLSTLVG